MTEKELIHYGILGMKWGRKKSKNSLSKARTMTKEYKKEKKLDALNAKKTYTDAAPLRSKKWKTKQKDLIDQDIKRVKAGEMKDSTRRQIAMGGMIIGSLMLDYSINSGRATRAIMNIPTKIANIIIN